MAQFPAPEEGVVLTHFIVTSDVARSRRFYVDVLGGQALRDGEPTIDIRVADIHAVYDQWRGRGASFLTPPVDHGRELRCYMRDPDGHLIEVGQATRIPSG
jgi:catechol 2,3-dioxygenase-like lactoylglutathione lyase family enzyme